MRHAVCRAAFSIRCSGAADRTSVLIRARRISSGLFLSTPVSTHISEMYRIIRLAIQISVIAAVIIALPYKLFELDRYFVPKELVLNAAALIVATALVLKRRSLQFDLVDGLIALFLLWSVASAIFA